MEHNERDLTVPIFIGCIVFIIVALSTYVYFENSYRMRHYSTIGTAILGSGIPHDDIYPLYPEVSWNDTETIVTKIEDVTFQNFQITSKPLQNPKNTHPVASSFHKYYDEKLKNLGWGEGDDAASGTSHSQWTYKKGTKYIILSYAHEQENNYQLRIITGGQE